MKFNYIYLRTSTEEQHPENQLSSCKGLAMKMHISNLIILMEKASAWKDVHREIFDKIYKSIESDKVSSLIVWDLDRLYRNRRKLISFFKFCKYHHCKIYSVRQEWLSSISSMEPPFDEIVTDLMIQIMGWISEEESSKKSARVKLAVSKKNNITYSKYGKKWGRKDIKKRIAAQVLELHNAGKSIRQISSQVWYWDKNRKRKQVSATTVFNILKKAQNSVHKL